MTGLMNDKIFSFLDELYPNPKCELVYNKDYEFLISVMLSAQTTDKRVNIVTKKLFSKYKTLDDLASSSISDIKSIIYSLGNYNKKAEAIIEISKSLVPYGKVLNDREFLEKLPMVGRKTVNVVLSELFNIPNIAVDTHVFRVSKRLNLVRKSANVNETEEELKRIIPKERWIRTHLQFVSFGRYFCTAKSPMCDKCKLKNICIEKGLNS
ncbi:MAG: endonuclease III [bacterium]|nr:endonuclease III [bacterium]